MKRFKFIFYILAIGSLFVGVFWFSAFLKLANANVTTITVDVAPVRVSMSDNHLKASHSAYQGIDIVTLVKEEPDYQLAIHYPEFGDDQLNQAISDYVSMTKADFFEELEANKEFLQDRPASFYLLFNIYPVVDDVYSIVFSNERYLGGANGEQSSKVFIVDLSQNRFISQLEMIDDHQENRDLVFQLLKEEFEQSEDYREFFFLDYLEEWAYAGDQTYENVYLTDRTLVFKFDKYQVTAGAAGSPEIKLPFVKVMGLLTDEWVKKLEIEKKLTDEVKQDNGVDQQGSSEEVKIDEDIKKVALTFDDGPDPTHTIEILRLLDEYQARATFFVLGNRVDFYPGIVKEISDRGHEIGNHTWNHKDLTTLDSAEIKDELGSTSEAIKQITGESPKLFRPPYGAINDNVRAATDLAPALWTVDPQDWRYRDADKVFKHVKANVTDDSIVLMHDIHGTTVEALERILAFLAEEGYQFVTVSELDS